LEWCWRVTVGFGDDKIGRNCLDNTCPDNYFTGMKLTGVRTMSGRRFDSPHQEVYLNLWRTYDRLRLLEDELFSGHGLTAQQYNALRLLRGAHPGKVPTLSLASRLVSRAPDITRLLDKLHERGLVERERPADNRRVVMVGITEPGIALLDGLGGEVRDCHLRQLGHLDQDEMRVLVDLLAKARQPHEPTDSNWR
jgi:DNA-binding MarR family transcriptional regulator